MTGNKVDNFRLSEQIAGINTITTELGLPSNILSLPGALECTMQNLITNKCTISSMPITPEALNFHSAKSL